MGPSALTSHMAAILTKRKSTSTFRTLTTAPSTTVDFSSNDFLSLSTSIHLKTAFLAEIQTSPSFRLGSGGSRLLDGNSPYAEKLEKDIAEFHKAPSALLFNSGFDANSGVFACVPQVGDVVLYDEFIHASVHEGMRLSRAGKRLKFAHNDVSDLKGKIKELKQDQKIRCGERNVFVAVESLYSMDGDLCPLKEVVHCVEELLPNGNGHIVVDEAHSNGVYGDFGRGIVCNLGLEEKVFVRLHTFGKGLACNGAVILCSPLTREYLINYARPLIYTTAMSFPSLAAIKVVYSLMRQGKTESLITHLFNLIEHMYYQLATLLPFTKHPISGIQLLLLPGEVPSSPIFALLTPEPRSLAKHCQAAGFMVRPIVPPTVPDGTQRVRVCLHAGNTYQDVEGLVSRIKNWLEHMRADGSGIMKALL